MLEIVLPFTTGAGFFRGNGERVMHCGQDLAGTLATLLYVFCVRCIRTATPAWSVFTVSHRPVRGRITHLSATSLP